MTFADLMSLLMCFFVLLLSFSEMDVQKYKQLSGSMKNAFGVQREVKAHEIPKGINVIAKEFSAGRPDPTPLNQVRQKTSSTKSDHLDWGKGAGDGGSEESDADIQKLIEGQLDVELKDEEAAAAKQEETFAQESEEMIRQRLSKEIKEGQVEVMLEGGNRVIIRIKEKSSFFSGSSSIRKTFLPVLDKIRSTLIEVTGEITVAGHTDNRPITTRQFRSNWDLSASRAISVAHELINGGEKGKNIHSGRIKVVGHADTRPIAPNDTIKNRAKNRRVEVVIVQKSGKARAVNLNPGSG